MSKIRAGIFGGSGYGGSELIKILLFHPQVEIAFVTANDHAGKRVSEVHRNLASLTELEFAPSPADISAIDDIDVAFFALPHGHALEMVPKLKPGIKVIDLSGDFRIKDADVFRTYYNAEHAGALQTRFVYGQTETNRDAIRSAQYIANPGCFATAAVLAIAPLAKSGLLNGKVIVDAKTGSSGSGAKPAANTHHPQRANSFYAYKPFAHQHVPEITQHLGAIASGFDNEFVFMSHSLPVSRGIFASCYFETTLHMTNEDLKHLFENFYQDSFFVRRAVGSPDINWVKNTNFCDIATHTSGKNVVVFSAIDNLVKGAAGQAVQNMNLMFGFEETTALLSAGGNP